MKKLACLLLAALLLVGCSPVDSQQQQVNEQNPSLPMPSAGSEADYIDETSGDHVTIQTGDYLDFPEGMPEGARVLPDLINLNYVMVQRNDEEDRVVYTLSWVSEQTAVEVTAFFKENLAHLDGYDFQESDSGTMIAAMVEDFEMTIMVQIDGDCSAFTMVLSNVPAVG